MTESNRTITPWPGPTTPGWEEGGERLSSPNAACRGCMFALIFEVLAAALCLACVALLRALGYC